MEEISLVDIAQSDTDVIDEKTIEKAKRILEEEYD